MSPHNPGRVGRLVETLRGVAPAAVLLVGIDDVHDLRHRAGWEVAADIILTVTLELSFDTLGMLGLLVLIRTFLHLILELEITGRWPWQRCSQVASDSGMLPESGIGPRERRVIA